MIKDNFIENRLATLANVLLSNVGALSVFVLCVIISMPSLEQLGIIESKQFEQLIFLENEVATLNHFTNQDGLRGSELD